ncbi:MAG: synthase subunit gamma [Candidatus Parcubacteria bacterium]|jgi:F-type H+-transporting ATPase subunit gamma
MASLKNIKLKIQSVKKTSTVTRAMEAVSAVKMRKSQERAIAGRVYAAAALSVLERMSGTAELKRHPLMQERLGKTCYVIVTSDKGLAGSLNSSVIRRAEHDMRERGLSKDNVVMIGVGRRGADYFANREYDMRSRFENMSDDVSEKEMRSLTDSILGWHASGEVSSVVVVYTNFVSTFEQEAIARQIAPISPSMFKELVAGIRPVRGRYAPEPSSAEDKRPATYTVEPDPDSVLDVLLPRLMNVAIFHAVLESKASEHSARRVAMKNATDNAKERAKEYTRTYNKVRQASITREISEITSGIEAMR